MFEKEAEEIAKDIYIHHFDDSVIYPNVLKAITVGVQKGAEFGYNKANKENAELKDKLNKIERKCRFNFVDLLHDVENESKQEEQLTNAKEIIKQLMKAIPYGSGKLATEAYDKAEHFLKETK